MLLKKMTQWLPVSLPIPLKGTFCLPKDKSAVSGHLRESVAFELQQKTCCWNHKDYNVLTNYPSNTLGTVWFYVGEEYWLITAQYREEEEFLLPIKFSDVPLGQASKWLHGCVESPAFSFENATALNGATSSVPPRKWWVAHRSTCFLAFGVPHCETETMLHLDHELWLREA